jgi:hypothetical protein
MAWRCRFCTHDLPPKALKCPQCGEWLVTATYRWDYKHFYLPVVEAQPSEAGEHLYDETAFMAELAGLGREGWELASLVAKRREGDSIAGYYVTMKRRGARVYDIKEAEAIERGG